jgi:integrase
MASRRRGHGDGGIRKRPDSRWEGTVDVTTYGRARRRKYVYGRTRAEVVERLRAVQHTRDEGLPVIDERVTLARFLQTWLDQVVRPQRGYATWQGYEVNVRRHIVPVLGKRTLAKLSPADVQALINMKREEGLAPRTVQYVHATLRAALGVALRWGVIARNVATLVEPVSVDRPAVVPFRPEEVQALLAAAAEERLGAFYTVALAVGLRPGGPLGLKWADIDLAESTLRSDGYWSATAVNGPSTSPSHGPAGGPFRCRGYALIRSSPTGTANSSSAAARRCGKRTTWSFAHR